jgi:hypothetical protein
LIFFHALVGRDRLAKRTGKIPLNEFFRRATKETGSCTVEIRTDNLETLLKHEAELIANLEFVQLAIRAHIAMQPLEARGGTKHTPPASDDDTSGFMDQVMSELGIQFSSVDIFEKAKMLKPNFDRKLLEKAVNRLQRTGKIHKIESGRGWRPARYQKSLRR